MLVTNKVAEKLVEFVPIAGGVVKFTKKAQQVKKISNPVTATTRGIGAVAIACSGPIIKYPVLCALMASSFAAGIATQNPAGIIGGLDFAEQILEELW